MIDTRNINFDFISTEGTGNSHYNKIFINDYFNKDNINSYDEISNNKYEEYYIFQKIYDHNGLYHNFYLRYSRNKYSFIVGESNVFSNSLIINFDNIL